MNQKFHILVCFHDAMRLPYYQRILLRRSVYGPFTKMSSVHDVINLKTINFPIGEKPPFDEVRSTLLMTFSLRRNTLQRFLITTIRHLFHHYQHCSCPFFSGKSMLIIFLTMIIFTLLLIVPSSQEAGCQTLLQCSPPEIIARGFKYKSSFFFSWP